MKLCWKAVGVLLVSSVLATPIAAEPLQMVCIKELTAQGFVTVCYVYNQPDPIIIA